MDVTLMSCCLCEQRDADKVALVTFCEPESTMLGLKCDEGLEFGTCTVCREAIVDIPIKCKERLVKTALAQAVAEESRWN